MASTQTTNEKKLMEIYEVLRISEFNKENVLKYVENILDSDYDMNYQSTLNSSICQKMPEYAGSTLLHFAVKFYRYHDFNDHDRFQNVLEGYDPLIDFFIEQGSDFTIKNNDGCTPLLLGCNDRIELNHKDKAIESLLFAHLDYNNTTNIYGKNGMSHFHVACTTNFVDVIEFFLKAGISVDACVNNDSPKYPGYTPLHFAAHCGHLQTIKLLVSYGANINSKDAKGWTPLHLLIEKHKELVFDRTLQSPALSYSISLPDDVGLTYLHISCISDNVELVKNLIKKGAKIHSSIKFDSPLWPGYTPLHVAFDQDKLSTAMLLLEKGANLLAKDARGKSPFDLCTEKYSLDKIIQILSTVKRYQSFKVKFIDGTCLLQVLYAFEDLKKLKKFLSREIKNINIYIPLDSPIWPRYNLLHLIVLFAKSLYLEELLLYRNVDCTMLNADGMTPLHLAFYLKKKDLVEKILNRCKRLSSRSINRDNMSNLHIACAAHHHTAIEYFLRKGSSPNLAVRNDIKGDEYFSLNPDVIRAGSTPFHILLQTCNSSNTDDLVDIIDTLLTYRANLNAVDVNGVTPFQIILEHFHEKYHSIEETLCQIMSDNKIKVKITSAISLIILRTSSFLLTTTPLFEKLCSEFLKERHYKKFGLTKLHAACALGDLSVVKKELAFGVDVNRSISSDSDIWPGDTALHILFRGDSWYKYEIADLLLEHGADITLKNASNLTPVHLSKEKDLEIAISLLRNKFTNVNPVNNEGLSHFHLSCMTNNELVVEEFLKSGVDVNSAVDTIIINNHDGFHDYAGYTALHFAVVNCNKEIVELLIKYGADLYSEDAAGKTPFHLIASSEKFDKDRMESLLRCPAINFAAVNRFGEAVYETVIENCIKSRNYLHKKIRFIDKIINFILNRGVHIDFARLTTEKLTGSKLIINTACYCSKLTFQRLINSVPDLTNVDDKGQNALHLILPTKSENPASVYNCETFGSCGDCETRDAISLADDYHKNIVALRRTAVEVNHKDNQGKTALHKAMSGEKDVPFEVLLAMGADVNIKDDKGNIPFVYLKERAVSDYDYDYIARELISHLKKLMLCGLFVDGKNKISDNHCLSVFTPNGFEIRKAHLDDRFRKQMILSISADEFFSEKFVFNYRHMPAPQRQAICNMFDHNNFQYFCSIFQSNDDDLINLQFRKARARTRLVEPAMAALQYFAGLNIPHLCLDFIIDYLDNNDLMNLVRAHNGKLIFAPLPKNC